MSSHSDSRAPKSGQEALADYVSALLASDIDHATSSPNDVVVHHQRSLVPEWGCTDFRCQLVAVGKILLAIPVEKILGTMAWEHSSSDSTVPILDTLISPDGQLVTVIDIARIVLPRDQWPRDRGKENGGMHPLVLVAKGQFGLLVDRLAEEIIVASKQITWRSEDTQRPWLAGTSKPLACALLDVDALIGLMDSAP